MDMQYYKQYEPIDGKWYITKELGSSSFGKVFELKGVNDTFCNL